MKKILSIAAAIILTAGTMAFAQDAEGAKPVFKFSGNVYTGLGYSFEKSQLRMYNETSPNTKINLNLAYTYGNVGAKGRVSFSPQSNNKDWAATPKFSKADPALLDSIKLERGFTTPYLDYGFLFANFLDGKITTQAGFLTTTPLTTSFFYNDYKGRGVTLQVKPIKELTFVANAYVPGSKLIADIDWATYWNTGMNYGVSYNADKFSVMAAYGSAIYWSKSNSCWTDISFKPVDMLSIEAEADFFNLFDENFTWEASALFDVTPTDALNVNLFATYGTYYGKVLDVELNGSYDINSKFNLHCGAGVVLDMSDMDNLSTGFGGKGGVKFTMGKKATVDLTYSYTQALFAENVWNTTYAGEGNQLALSFNLSF